MIEIDLADLKEPVLRCPNDPDDAKLLSEVAGAKIDEVFIGSCMTNIGHFRAAGKLLEGKRDIPVKLWVAPPTQDGRGRAHQGRPLRRLRRAPARAPRCPAAACAWATRRRCARARRWCRPRRATSRTGWARTPTCISPRRNSRRSRPSSGGIPTVAEYHADMGVINADRDQVYRYMNFDQIDEYAEAAK